MSNPISKEVTETKSESLLREIMSGTPLRIALSAVLAFMVGAIFMAAFNQDVVDSYATFGSDPMYTLQTAWDRAQNEGA